MKAKVILGIAILMILGSIIAIGNRPVHNLIEYDENTTLALFNENGEKIDQVPSKDSGYTLDTEKSSCTNGNVSWDFELWSPVVTVNDEVNGRVSCSLYFKESTPYDECVSKYGSDSIQCSIIADADTEGCPVVNADGTVGVTGVESENGYLCSAPDDYGTSYYYRGNVTNNYVKFGTNESGQDMYWRILRINGDGSIRMIYDGTSAHANGESSEDRQIGTSYYNYYWKKDNVEESPIAYVYYDNAGVGYMYGNRDGIVEGSTQYGTSIHNANEVRYYAKSYSYNETTDRFVLVGPVGVLGSEMNEDYVGWYTFNGTSTATSSSSIYKVMSVQATTNATVGYSYVSYGTTSMEKAQTNMNDSTIKDYLDDWYESVFFKTEYERYITDSLFCNDRTLYYTTPSGYSQLGYGTEITAYQWYDLNSNGVTLNCFQQKDRFTMDEAVGNGALTYPVGLITTDEVYLAGGYNYSNSGYYLYTGNQYWTMSPYDFNGLTAGVRIVDSEGLADSYNYVGNSRGVRPIINLKADSLKSGDGTANNPYKVN